jgi:hypothetical protein
MVRVVEVGSVNFKTDEIFLAYIPTAETMVRVVDEGVVNLVWTFYNLFLLTTLLLRLW